MCPVILPAPRSTSVYGSLPADHHSLLLSWRNGTLSTTSKSTVYTYHVISSSQQTNNDDSEDYEAEIQVGLYDQWLRQLDFGPTQADRVLVHTNMMESAHERRFAACQASIDFSHFEADHSRRIKQAVDHLQTRINDHTTRELDDSEEHDDEGLIGLSQSPSKSTETDCSQFATHPTRRLTALVQAELSSMLQHTNPSSAKRARCTADELLVADADADDYASIQEEVYGQLLAVRKKLRQAPPNGCLQLKTIRYRGDAVRSGIKKAGK